MALERRAFLQAMVSRPLVAATVTGMLLEDVTAGVAIGLFFELLHLGNASLGMAQAEHDTLPAVAGAVMACELGHASLALSTAPMWALAALATMPLGALGQRLEARLDSRARKYFGRAIVAVDEGQMARAARQNLRAMWPQFTFYALCGVAVAGLAHALAPAVLTLPARALRGLTWSWAAMALTAAGVAIQGSRARQRWLTAGLAALLAVLVGLALGGRA